MNLKSHIPNAVTLLNLISGALAIILLFNGYVVESALFIGLAAVFDFFDGFLAKLFNVKSLIGKELDSLADVISFGLAPAYFLYFLMSKNEFYSSSASIVQYLPFLALLIAAFSAFRLAKFNLDTRQTVSFLGLPTPANAVFIVSFCIVALKTNGTIPVIDQLTGNYLIQLAVIPLSSFLLISEVPMFSLKFNKGYGLNGNMIRYSFLFITLILILLLNWTGILLSMVVYVILSLLFVDK